MSFLRSIIDPIINQFGLDVPAIAAQAICFITVLLILHYFAIKPILANITKRQKEIADGLEYAKETKQQLADAQNQIAAERQTAQLSAQKIIDDASKAATQLSERERIAAQQQNAQLLEKTRETLTLEKQKILEEARTEVARLVVATTQQVLQQNLTDPQRAQYTQSAAQQLSKE